MTVIQGSFAAVDRTKNPDDEFAEIRQKVVDSLHQTLDSTKHGWLFPTFLVEAVENEVWLHPRRLTNSVIPKMTLPEFIRAPYPRGLGTGVDVIEKLIAGNERALLAWDKAWQREPGAPAGNRNAAKAKQQSTDNNVNGCFDTQREVSPQEPSEPKRPVGNSADYGLRRLRHAQEEGDARAAELLRRVVDPKDDMSVNRACKEMGWRKDPSPLMAVKSAWRRASQEEREEIAAWVDAQMSPLKGSRFG